MRRLILKLMRRRRLERDLEAELVFHEEMSRTEGAAIGLGNRTRVKEAAREVWRWQFVENAVRDLAQEIRCLRRAPAFTAAAVLTLALAIGANAAIFTLVHRIVLNPLLYPDSDRLIDLDHAAPGANLSRDLGMTLGLYFHYRERARTLEEVALHSAGEATLAGRGEPERIRRAVATPSLVAVLRVSPARGQWFAEEDALPGAPLVAVLSHGLWMRRFGGAPEVLGQAVSVDGEPAEIIGVMPPSFAFPDPHVELWTPLQSARTMVWNPFSHRGVARLGDGLTVDDARAELNGLIRRLPADYPGDPALTGLVDSARLTSVAWPLKDIVIRGNVAEILWLLLASVGFVLLVAGANVANLFLVRSEARQRELAVRRALGAGRAAVARCFAAESLLISGAGTLLGIALAWSAVRLLTRFGPASLPRLEEVHLDPTVIAFAVFLGLVTAVVLGVLPLLGAAPASASLHERGRGATAGAGRHRVRYLLMGAQVALAFLLFVAAGLMIRSFQNLRAIDPGFDSSSTLTFRIGLPQGESSTSAAVRTHHAVLDAISAIPGVVSASASTRIPLTGVGGGFSDLRVEGRVIPESDIPPIVAFRAVAGDYFETMGTPVLRGRGLERVDVERGDFVAVVNEAFVSAYFSDQNPIGARVARGQGGVVNSDWLTIVGVVANTPFDTLPEATAADARPELYLPMSVSGPPETPDRAANGPGIGAMSYVVRSSVPPFSLLGPVRQAIDKVDANLAIAQVQTLRGLVDGASRQAAFITALIAIAAAVALVLGLVGIHGVIAYVVSRRTNEIGIRLALGADPRAVTAMIVRQGGVVIVAGVIVGFAAALAGARLIEALLYEVSPRDPAVLAATAFGLLGVALLACWLAARRSARISPTEALRAD